MKQRIGTLLVFLGCMASGHAALAVCGGDCSGDGEVTINELVLGVNIALETATVDQCAAFDADNDGAVTINEVVAAVNNALNGCQPVPTVTATSTAQTGPTPTPASSSCANGVWDMTFTDVSSDSNATTSEENLDYVSGVYGSASLALNGTECPVGPRDLTRSIQVSYLVLGDLKPGTYPFDGIIRTLYYGENASPNTVRIWSTHDGNLVIDAVDGKRLTFHITAKMVPSGLGSFGGPPKGTFVLHVSGVVEQVGP